MYGVLPSERVMALVPEHHASIRPQRTLVCLTEDVRTRFIQHIQASPGNSLSSAARAFGIPKSTAYDIARRYMLTGQITPKPRGGSRCKKLTLHAEQALFHWVDNSADITLKRLAARLQSSFGITVSEKTVSKSLTKSGYTMKLLRTIPIGRNTPEVISARREYAFTFMNEAPSDRRQIIWIDESGFNMHLRRKYGRALAGLRANVVVANSRGYNLSICAAMSEEGLLSHKIHRGAYNSTLFCAFLEQLCMRLQTMDRTGCWLVLDNVRFHHCAVVAQCVASHGHRLLFLPPYSPMLNPIESLFGKWKTSIRTRNVVFSQEALLANIEAASQEITIVDCLGWIRDVNRNLAPSLLGEPFID